jgi:hypothetical protein
MTMTPEERQAYLLTLGYPPAVGALPLPDEINETNLLDQVKVIALAVRTISDIPVGD